VLDLPARPPAAAAIASPSAATPHVMRPT